jgi:hypothetical protein
VGELFGKRGSFGYAEKLEEQTLAVYASLLTDTVNPAREDCQVLGVRIRAHCTEGIQFQPFPIFPSLIYCVQCTCLPVPLLMAWHDMAGASHKDCSGPCRVPPIYSAILVAAGMIIVLVLWEQSRSADTLFNRLRCTTSDCGVLDFGIFYVAGSIRPIYPFAMYI